jgi:hypothetical protein
MRTRCEPQRQQEAPKGFPTCFRRVNFGCAPRIEPGEALFPLEQPPFFEIGNGRYSYIFRLPFL